MKQRIYIDTSVIGGCFDAEFEKWSNRLFDELIEGQKIAVVSDITYREIELAPKQVHDKLFSIPEDYREDILTNTEVETLAENYVKSGANATIQKADIVVSWNFKHIVNLDRIRKYNAVNLMFGYSTIEIRTPREILKDLDDEN